METLKDELIHYAHDYTDKDIKLIKKWTALAAKQGILVERTAWLEEMIQQGHMFSLKQQGHINLFFLLRVLFKFDQAKVGVSQNGMWRHPHSTYGAMTNNAIIKCSLKLDLSATFIAVYKHNHVGNSIFCDDTNFKQIELDQVNPKIFSNDTFQPNAETMFLKYYTPFDKHFLKKREIII